MSLLYNIHSSKSSRIHYMRYVIILMLLGFFMQGNATHIIGGDLQYRCIGNDRYEITLIFVRDCENANPEAVIDNPAIVSFYDENYKPLLNVGGLGSIGHIKMSNFVQDTLYDILADPCEGVPGHLCVEKTVYRDTVRLPHREGGYRLAYQRCCRNMLIQNIIEPLNTGATFETYITGEALLTCNSGPQLEVIPDLYTCVGTPIELNQTFTDAEGDSIVYSLCTPNAGSSRDKPIPGIHPPGPFPDVEWESNYSTLDMLNNPDDPIRINSDGIITGTPLNTGTYLIGFCIKEYRNGVLLSEHNRDFELTVLSCDEVPIARFEAPELVCDGNQEINFINNSENADIYTWYFDLSDSSLISNEDSPTYTYPDTGCYEMMLVAGVDGRCYDTLRQTICIYDDALIPDFAYESLDGCADSLTMYFYDQSTDSTSHIVDSDWEIIFNGDTIHLSGDTVSHTFNEQGTAIVTLTSTAANGCSASITDNDVKVNFFTLELVGDSLSICLGEDTPLLIDGDPDLDYTFTPEKWLDLSEPGNPIAKPDSSLTYYVEATDGVCTVSDSIYIEVRGEGFAIVDLSDTCSIHKLLTTNNFTHTGIIWSKDPDFNRIIGFGDSLEIEVRDVETVYVSLRDSSINCNLEASYTIEHAGLNLNNPEDFMLCAGDKDSLLIENLNDLDFTIQWEDNPIILSDLNDPEVVVQVDTVGESYLVFFAEAENGCTYSDTIHVIVNESVNADFAFANECGSLTVDFTNLSNVDDVEWDFGDGETSTEEHPTHTYNEPGTYTVILEASNGCHATMEKTITVDDFDVPALDDVVYNCEGEDTGLNPGGNPDLNYNWEPTAGLDDPQSYNPVVNVSDTTMYYVTITDENTDCESFDSVMVVPVAASHVELAFINECGSLTVFFTNLSDSSNVVWDFGDGNTSTEENPTHTYDSPGSYTVTLGVDDVCAFAVSVEITVDEFAADVPSQVSACFGNAAELNSGGNQDLNYHWEPTTGLDDPNSYNPMATIVDSTTYYVTITDDNTDCETIDSVLVVPVDTFTVTTSADLQVCIDDPVTIEASSSEGTITWYDDSGSIVGTEDTLTIIPGQSTYYVAEGEVLGCYVTDTVFVDLIDLEDFINISADPDTIDFGERSQLNVDVIGREGEYTYSWHPTDGLDNPNIKNPVARPKETTEYCVTVIDDTGCEATMCVTVVVRESPCQPPYIFLPNAFSPNGDGNNDVLFLRGEAITDMKLIIYNRWGEEVFMSTDKNIGWDGTDKNGRIMPTDVYGYHFQARCGDEDRYEEKGNVSLMR